MMIHVLQSVYNDEPLLWSMERYKIVVYLTSVLYVTRESFILLKSSYKYIDHILVHEVIILFLKY